MAVEPRLVLSPREDVDFDFEKSGVARSKYHRFKRFERIVHHYKDGHVLTIWLFPDGHREMEVKG